MNVLWPLVPPKDGMALCVEARVDVGVWEEDATDANFGGVVVPHDGWVKGDKLVDASGARCDVVVHPTEVCEGIVDSLVERNAAFVAVAEGFLHEAEEH